MNTAMATKYKLNYYNTRGSGEPIRFLLSYGEVPFVDNRVTINQWQQMRTKVPFEKLPTLEVGDQEGYQVLAICRYLGGQFGLRGGDDWTAAEMDAVADTLKDLHTKMLNIYMAHDCVVKELQRQKLIKETFPLYFSKFNQVLEDNGGYFVGGKLSWVDLYFAAGFEMYGIIAQDDEVMKTYPNLCKLNETVRSIPQIRKWLKKRPFSAF